MHHARITWTGPRSREPKNPSTTLTYVQAFEELDNSESTQLGNEVGKNAYSISKAPSHSITSRQSRLYRKNSHQNELLGQLD